jgi:probable F420-dependent oxidoreductase
VKVRVGYGLGVRGPGVDGGRFGALIDGLEQLGFDSLWLSERATGPIPDPLIGLSVAAGRTSRIKLGTSVQVLPGRNPVLLAKEWATLDRLSNGRALPAFGLGVVEPVEQQAFGVERGERAPLFDEALGIMRRLWTEETIDHDGPRYHYQGVGIGIRPVQHPPDVWLGGRAPGELKRVGRLADGWLPSFTTPELCVEGREQVVAAATDAGREIDPEHWGVLVPYAHGAVPDAVAQLVEQRLPGVDVRRVVAVGLDALRAQIQDYVSVGFSKLVAVPFEEPDDWDHELERLADAVLDLQT